ncbi:MAG: PAS domain S-box protein, partial [Alphaproteobacteria bacterium]|nr:PAS domain S-box protein [Alphaproteobacteria bacterium]
MSDNRHLILTNATLDAVDLPLLALDHNFYVEFANHAFLRLFDVEQTEIIGRPVFELGNGQWNIPELRRLLDNVLAHKQSIADHEIEHHLEGTGQRVMRLNARCLDHLSLIILAIRDVTEQVELDRIRRQREARQNLIIELNDRLRSLSDPVAIQAAASELLGRHLGAGQVAYAEIDEAVQYATIERDWNDGTIPSNVARHRLKDFGAPLTADLVAGRTVIVNDTNSDPRTAAPMARRTLDKHSISAFLNVPMIKGNRLVAVLAIHSREPRTWSAAEVAITQEVGDRAWAAIQRAHAEDALRASEQRLARDLEDMHLLKDISTRLVPDQEPTALFDQLVHTAKALMRADAASLQEYHSDRARLRLIASSGLGPEVSAQREWIDASSGSSFGRALETTERIVISDLRDIDLDQPDLAALSWPGLKAVQSTPLVSRSGEVLGMLSTFWRRPQTPSERQLRQFDVLARLAADLIERVHTISTLRENEARFRSLASMASDWYWEQDENFRFTELSKSVQQLAGSSDVSHIGKTRWELPHIGVSEETWAEHRALLERHESFRDFEYRRISEQGQTIWMNANGDPVFDAAGTFKGYRGTGTNITIRKEAEARLRASEARQRIATQAAGLGVFEWFIAENRVVWENDRMYELFGLSPTDAAVSREAFFAEYIHPDDIDAFECAVRAGVKDGDNFAATCRIHRKSDGVMRWLEFAGRLQFGADGNPDRVIGVVADITERQRHEQHIQLLMREVNHRSKNMLALIQAIARQTVANGPEDFMPRFSERLRSLAAAQDLLIQNRWTAVPLADLVRAQLSHFIDLIGDRITVTGPSLLITPAAAQTLGLTLHELATNAVKHGALSTSRGTVTIAWDAPPTGDGGQPFTISWTERGGPSIRKPERSGFGSLLTSKMVEISVGGEVSIDYAPAGLVWRLTCPVGRIVEGRLDMPNQSPSPNSAPRESRRIGSGRILVVEDEALIATELEDILTDANFEVLGPAGSVKHALDLIDRIGCDAAVLDLNLGGNETSEPIARRLMRDGTPFVVVSGYTRS